MSRIIGAGLQRRLAEKEARVRRGWQSVFEDLGTEMQAAYARTTRNWRRKPGFTVELTFSKERYAVVVRPGGSRRLIYRFVDTGTKAHIIRARAGKVLRFQTGHVPKTLPGARANVGSGARTGPWVSKRMVAHPGTRPRGFSRKIAADFKADFPNRIRESYRRSIGG